MTVLIFPCSLSAAISFSQEAKKWGRKTVGASSIDLDSSAIHYDAWVKLPLIGSPTFFDELNAVISKYSISSIYTAHAPTYHLIKSRIKYIPEWVTILGSGPFETQMDKIKSRLSAGKILIEEIAKYSDFKDVYYPEFVGALISEAENIHGECAREKMAGIFAAMQDAPQGDVVEIGVLFGKSCYLLNRIAVHLGIGATLAVDPWDLGLSVQYDAPKHIQEASNGWDWDVVATGFFMNMLASSAQPFNYLRAPSSDAYDLYSKNYKVTSFEFGSTQYKGVISILHLDGNHDEESVSKDFELWHKLVCPGGWIIFDDYFWSHGNGPRNVANSAIEMLGSRIKRHFVAGGALFVKLN